MAAKRSTDVAPLDGRGADFDPWPSDAEVHVAWEAAGAGLAAERGDLIVVVDVLSFSTSVTTAVAQGAVALSYSEAEIDVAGGRQQLCADVDADIVSKSRAVLDGDTYSLSPASLASIGPGERLIFTSLNGARCTAAASAAPAVVVGCLLNASAVAEWIHRNWLVGRRDGGRRCTLIACGERWSSTAGLAGSNDWRAAAEDQLGVGAIAAALAKHGMALSVEASIAAGVFSAVEAELAETLAACVSGRELIARGFADDVTLAAAVDSVGAVPVWNTVGTIREFVDSPSGLAGSPA